MKLDRCPTCKRRYVRSGEANRRLWALYHAMAEKIAVRGQHFSADTWHLWAKSKWLGCTDHVLPNGKTLTVPASTAGLDVQAFSDFMTAVESWANEHGVYLEDDVFA
jgi:hypothetical protein